MKVTDKLKQVIFKRLYKELGNVEIIPYNNSVWFIDRENTYWYLNLSNGGCLYWRYSFFPSFFTFFSLGQSEFEPIISEWVEEVLNHKVKTSTFDLTWKPLEVEEVLNHKVDATDGGFIFSKGLVEDVLNHKVKTSSPWNNDGEFVVGKVLNHKVETTIPKEKDWIPEVEKVLNHKVETTKKYHDMQPWYLEKVLKNTEQNESNG